MSIAQPEVAGEGQLRRASCENVNVYVVSSGEDHGDAAAFAALRTEETTLPWVIHHAQARAQRIDEIPQRARNVLAALARTVDAARPYAAIYARRGLLTERAMQSERTFYRSLADLEQAGLITRTAQARYVEVGKFGRVHLNLTERAAVLLGLAKPVPAPTPTEIGESFATGVEPSATTASTTGNPVFQGPSANVADGAIYGNLSPASSQKRQPGQVPADLQRLLTLGFSKFLVFGLMRQARDAGKRLSDVVEATWPNLKQAVRPICYLQALLRSPVDFGFQVRTRDAGRRAARDAVAEREDAAVFAGQHAGQTFVDAKGEQLLVVDANGQGASIQAVHEGVQRRVPSSWAIGFVRAYRSGVWRPATDADAEAFAQERRRHVAVLAQPTPVPRQLSDSGRSALALAMAALRGRSVPTLR